MTTAGIVSFILSLAGSAIYTHVTCSRGLAMTADLSFPRAKWIAAHVGLYVVAFALALLLLGVALGLPKLLATPSAVVLGWSVAGIAIPWLDRRVSVHGGYTV